MWEIELSTRDYTPTELFPNKRPTRRLFYRSRLGMMHDGLALERPPCRNGWKREIGRIEARVPCEQAYGVMEYNRLENRRPRIHRIKTMWLRSRRTECCPCRSALRKRNHAISIEKRSCRGYERAKSRRPFTSFSFASSARRAVRYLGRASPCATKSFPAPQVNSARPYFTARTSAIIRA